MRNEKTGRDVKLDRPITFILSTWCFVHGIIQCRDLIGPRTRTGGRSSSLCRPRIPRKTLGRNLNKSFTVEEPATIGRAEHGNDLALNADVTNFLGCPHNLPFKSSPIGVEKTLVDAPSSSVAVAKLTELLVLVYQTKCIVICTK